MVFFKIFHFYNICYLNNRRTRFEMRRERERRRDAKKILIAWANEWNEGPKELGKAHEQKVVLAFHGWR
jgi:hypothetical protein